MYDITVIYTNGRYTFWSPDGIGRVWYDDPAYAMEDSGYDTVVWISDDEMAEELNK